MSILQRAGCLLAQGCMPTLPGTNLVCLDHIPETRKPLAETYTNVCELWRPRAGLFVPKTKGGIAMPTLDKHGRLTGKFKSIDHFIDCHTKLCKKCDGEMLPYELDKDGVCVYCKVLRNTKEDER